MHQADHHLLLARRVIGNSAQVDESRSDEEAWVQADILRGLKGR